MAGKKKSAGGKSRPSSSFATSNRKLTCPTCGYVTFLKARYTKHVKYHTMPFIKCEFCEFESQYSWNLERHMKNHNNSDGKKMQCPLCNFACDMKQSLTSHVQNHHKDVPEEIMAQFRTSCASSPRKSPNSGSRRQSAEYFIQDVDIDNSYENQEEETSGDEMLQMLSVQQRPLEHSHQKKVKRNGEVDGDDRNLFMKKFYKCRLCSFNALSELGLSRHVSQSHKNSNSAKSGVGGAGVGTKSSNAKIQNQMPTLYKKHPAMDGSTGTSRRPLNNSGVKPMPIAKPMPSLIPIPKSSGLISSSPVMQGKLHSSLLNTPNHQNHERESKPMSNSFQQQIQSRHQNKSEVEEEVAIKKIQFLQSLGLTLKSAKSPTEKPLSSYYTHKNKPNYYLTSRKVGPQRRSSFFEKLSKKLTSNQNNKEDTPTLSQASESTDSIMKETKSATINKNNGGNNNSIISITSNSTRCQYCRHRNKTSQDLMNHLEQCQEAQRFLAEEEENEQEMEINEGGEQQIFVWNNGGCGNDMEELDEDEDCEDEINQENDNMNQAYFHNFEGFSGLTLDLENYEKQVSSPTRSGGGITDTVSPKSNENSVTKSRKVYKCPQKDCEFWATTASRFHVHIVAHYNTKPFECSQCSYRSNWRWDITKHIKLKTMRDPGHTKAKVLLTHRSGERNYRKYDRYLVPMSVTYSADAKLPDCSTVASKRSDVELDSSPSPVSQKQKSNPKTSFSSSPSSPSAFIPMPKLTKAPHSSVDVSYKSLRDALNSESLNSSNLTPPPLPILTPIITISPYVPSPNSKSSVAVGPCRTFVEKRMLAGGEILQNMESLGREITVTPIKSSSNSLQVPGQNKSTGVTWKCKKCSFKNSNKNLVIDHINQNHQPKSGESMSILSQNNLVELGRKGATHVGSGYLSMSTNNTISPTSNLTSQQSYENWENSPLSRKKVGATKASYNCDNCGFSTSSASEMTRHGNCGGSEGEEFHSQRDAEEHDIQPSEVVSMAASEEDDNDCWEVDEGSGVQNELILPEEICAKPPRGSEAQQSGLIFKKYHCQECPYVTDSKGQFIYHKKFHTPSPNSPYKCGTCSYRVSHKHLLQQHVRVHSSENGSPSSRQLELDEVDQDAVFLSRPRLMIWKDGQPYSVVRCCFCPQVFVREEDLAEHEDEHQRKEIAVSSAHGQSQYQSYDDNSDEEVDDNEIHNGVLNLSTKSGQGPNSVSALEGTVHSPLKKQQGQGQTLLYLCQQCPARFLYEKELRIHKTFHERRNEFKCQLCSYSARQAVPHLMSHMKVHSTEYQDKTRSLLQSKCRAAPKFDSHGNNKNFHSPPSPHGSQRMPILKRMPPVSISPSTTIRSKVSNISDASIPCRRCPARFNSLVSFISHSHHHGMETEFKCKHCDFGAETQNNLTLHSILHAGSEVTIEPDVQDGDFVLADLMKGNSKDLMDASTVEHDSGAPFHQIPTVVPGADKVDHQTQICQDGYMDFSVAGAGAFQGNPEFKYQTYIKNGKVKSKRYKCCKCPSAFEKRDQYKVHMGLHGSDQRYKCTVCDYSVTYYANFIQHLKKHENQANVTKEQLIATPLSRMNKVVPPPSPSTQQPRGQRLVETSENKKKIVPPLVLKVPKTGTSASGKSTLKNHLACSKCPFKTNNISILSEHEEGHGTGQKEKCPFCCFSSKDKESLKGHLRVHFDTEFTPAVGVPQTRNDHNGATSPTDSSDSEVENEDYEAVVKKANKKKITVSFKPEISVEYC